MGATSVRNVLRRPFRMALVKARPRRSEDCLFVNVWKPAVAAPGAKLPVMVWIRGGTYTFGSSSHPGFSGVHSAR